jgi:hypothetical protein
VICLTATFQGPSARTLPAAIMDARPEAFNSRLDVVSENIRLVNLIYDAGTVVTGIVDSA